MRVAAMRITARRWRARPPAAGLAPRRRLAVAAAAAPFPPALLAEVAAHSSGWRVQQQLADLADVRTKLHRDDYGALCAAQGLDEQQAAALLERLEGAGVVARLSGGSLAGTLFLRPDEGLLRLVSANLDLPYVSADQRRIDRLTEIVESKEAQLAPQLSEKERLDAAANKSARRTVAAMLTYLTAQNAFFFWMTFYVWSWDILEPITYFWGQLFMLSTGAYFVRTQTEWGFSGVVSRMVAARRLRLATKAGFDVKQFDARVKEIELYRQRIRHLEKIRL